MKYFYPNNNLKGILSYLSKSKVLYEKAVIATETSYHSENGWSPAKVILDQKSNKSENKNCWCSINNENEHVDIEFKIQHIKTTAFSIKTHMLNTKYGITNFSLEGSNDTVNYVELYRHNGTEITPMSVNLFICQRVEAYNHFRLKLLSPTANPV